MLRLYTREPDYGQVATRKEQADGVICHVITSVEMVSAFTGRRARKLLSGRAYQTALEAFKTDWPTFRHVVVDEERELAFQNVERVRVLPMHVRVGAGPSVGEVRLRDAELLEGRLDHDPSVEERLAFADSVNGPWHRPRV